LIWSQWISLAKPSLTLVRVLAWRAASNLLTSRGVGTAEDISLKHVKGSCVAGVGWAANGRVFLQHGYCRMKECRAAETHEADVIVLVLTLSFGEFGRGFGTSGGILNMDGACLWECCREL
jgi:hypothetical protein